MGVFLSKRVCRTPYCGWVSRSLTIIPQASFQSDGTHLVPWMLLGIPSPAVRHVVCSSFSSHCALCCSQLICILATLSNYINPREANTGSKDIHFFQNTLFHKRMSHSTLSPTVYTMSISSNILFSNDIRNIYMYKWNIHVYTNIYIYVYKNIFFIYLLVLTFIFLKTIIISFVSFVSVSLVSLSIHPSTHPFTHIQPRL